MRQNKNQRNKKTNTRKSRNGNAIHSGQNLDQQQNIISTRRTLKVRDCKINTKYWYDYTANQSMVFNGNVVQLCAITQGTRSDQRVGDKIVVRKIEMKYVIASPPSDAYNQVRFLLVYSPNYSMVLANFLDGNAGTGGIDPLCFTKPYSTGTTFVVLHDQTHLMNVSSSNSAVHGEISIPCNLPSTWDYAQNIESGYFALITLGDSNFSPHPVITYNIRSQYTDL